MKSPEETFSQKRELMTLLLNPLCARAVAAYLEENRRASSGIGGARFVFSGMSDADFRRDSSFPESNVMSLTRAQRQPYRQTIAIDNHMVVAP